MKLIDKYLAISWAAVKNNLAYVGEVGSRIFFLAVILYIFMQLWKASYAHSPKELFSGLSLNQIMWYLTLTESVVMSAPRVSHRIDEEVRTGTLCVQLLRPISYPLYWLCTIMGERAIRFVITLLAGSALSWMLVGAPENLGSQLGFALLAIPLAFVLDFLGHFLIGLCAFWMEDTTGIYLIYWRLTVVLGGMMIPFQLLPDWLSHVLRVLPFASVVYAPANLFMKPTWPILLQSLAQQIVWIAVYAIAVWFVYKQAMARVASHGG